MLAKFGRGPTVVSKKGSLKCISRFADDTSLISNTCSFKNNSSQNHIDQISLTINVELG